MARSKKPTFRIEEKELKKWMKKDVAPVIDKLTHKVADDVDTQHPMKVTTGLNEDGRPFGLITILDAEGLLEQAKRGVLTKAAANNGLQVKRYVPKPGSK